MAIESREDLQRFIREHGRKATERELQSGDFGVSVGDIARDLYQPWAKEEALGISRGNPIAHQRKPHLGDWGTSRQRLARSLALPVLTHLMSR